MENEVKKTSFKVTKKKVIITVSSLIALLLILVAAQLIYTRANSDRVCEGVYINNVDVGNLTKSELQSKLNILYVGDIADKTIDFNSRTLKVSFSFDELGVKYSISALEKMVLEYGKEGNIFQEIFDIFYSKFNHKVFTMPFSYDKPKLIGIIANLADATCKNVIEPKTMFEEKQVTIAAGINGEKIDAELFVNETEDLINKCISGSVAASIIDDEPETLNADALYNKISKKVVNATVKIVGNKMVYKKESNGIEIDKDLLEDAVNNMLQGKSTKEIIPIKTTYPTVTVADLEASIFKDVLGEYTTQFYQRDQNEINRTNNIRLASSKINGTIIGAGNIFSYNTIVGQRTIEDGYKNAYIYRDGKIVSDLGGGICQVSSTLYNAVLYAGLNVVERRNHMFIVSYTELGMDATVFYGSTDFKFRNSTNMPIKITCSIIPGNRLYFKIVGTNPHPSLTYEYSPVIRSTTPYNTEYINSSAYNKGYSYVSQLGHNGYTIDVYKTTRNKGKVISKTRITTSVYKVVNQQIVRGTRGLGSGTASATPKPGASKTPKPHATRTPGPTTAPPLASPSPT